MPLKHGTTRIVLLTKKWAFKFPTTVSWSLFLKGLLGNMQEVQFSELDRHKLAPVKFHIPGGFLVVMPRCLPLDRESFDNLDFAGFVDGGDYVLPVENKLDSFGVLDDKIVAVDYG